MKCTHCGVNEVKKGLLCVTCNSEKIVRELEPQGYYHADLSVYRRYFPPDESEEI